MTPHQLSLIAAALQFDSTPEAYAEVLSILLDNLTREQLSTLRRHVKPKTFENLAPWFKLTIMGSVR